MKQVYGKYCIAPQVCKAKPDFSALLYFFSFPLSVILLSGSNQVYYNLDPKIIPQYTPQGGQIRQVRCERSEMKDVHVPLPTGTLSSQPHTSHSHLKSTKKSVAEEEALEDWNRQMGELFEWVGMACLGAQRWASIPVHFRL